MTFKNGNNCQHHAFKKYLPVFLIMFENFDDIK